VRRYFASQNFSAILDAKETGDYSAFIPMTAPRPKIGDSYGKLSWTAAIKRATGMAMEMGTEITSNY
jgi:hypothetical protein